MRRSVTQPLEPQAEYEITIPQMGRFHLRPVSYLFQRICEYFRTVAVRDTLWGVQRYLRPDCK